jgi:hypothetical protein
MFHPLVSDLNSLKDLDIENKITELGKKWAIAARMGNGDLASQILIVLEQYKFEQQKRSFEKTQKVSVNNQDKNLDDLININ